MIVGPTKSGKTCELVAELRNKGRKHKTLVVNHEKDDTKGYIFSQPHIKESAVTLDGLHDLVQYTKEHFNDFDILFIDNIHLFDEFYIHDKRNYYIDDLIEYLTHRGKKVFATGTEFNVEGNMMPRIPELLARAEYVKKMKTLCPLCASQGFLKEIATRSKLVHGEVLPVDLFHYYHPNEKMALENIPPDFIFFVGPMFTQKTFSDQGQFLKYDSVHKFLQRYYNQGLKIIAVKPKIDDRYGTARLYCHDDVDGDGKVISSIDIPCTIIDSSSSLYELINQEKPRVVLYEEMMFHDFATDAVSDMLKNNITVLGSSLDMDRFASPFRSAPGLLALATVVEKRRGKCIQKDCGYDSTRTYKQPGDSDAQIIVGGKGEYSAMCRYHHSLENPLPNVFGFKE